MSTILVLGRDPSGAVTYSAPFSSFIFGGNLAANAAQSFTIPAYFKTPTLIFSFEPGAGVWVAHNTTAALPTNTVGVITSELNPNVRYGAGGDTISFITADTTASFSVLVYEGNGS